MACHSVQFPAVLYPGYKLTWHGREGERDNNNELTVQLAASAEEGRIMSCLSNYGRT